MNESRMKNFINGYIEINVEGLNPEKFINLAAKSGITMWDIQRINYTTIQLKMKHSQYKRLRNIVVKTGCRCRIIKKYGMNFLFYKASKRKFFAAGIIIFAAFILYFSSFVWSIEIEGNRKIDTQKIYEAVNRAGLKKGEHKYKIDLRNVENSVQKQIAEISVINIKYSGTKAKVNIVERTMPPVVKTNEPANIIADKEGIILKVVAYKGQPAVKEGDIVKKEQVLISGILTDSQNVPQGFVHAMGIVTAKTWYESIEEVNTDYSFEERTGKERQKIYLELGNKNIYIKNDNIDFKKYDKIEEKHYVSIAGFGTPVMKITEHFYETKTSNKKIGYSEAMKIAEEKAENNIKKQMPSNAKFIDRKVERQMGNNKVKVKVLYITQEDIGILKQIK